MHTLHAMNHIDIEQASQQASMTNHQGKGAGMDVPDTPFHASPPNTYHQKVDASKPLKGFPSTKKVFRKCH